MFATAVSRCLGFRRRPSPTKPYVPQLAPSHGPGPCIFKFSNVTLAVEIVEHILSFLDRPRDLLALALTSKSTHGIIIPVHLQTRLIRCDLRRVTLWKTLPSSPLIAARFVSLQLIDEDDLFPPLSSTLALGTVLPVFLFDSSSAFDNDMQLVRSSRITQDNASEQLIPLIPFMASLTSFHFASYEVNVTPNIVAALRDSCPNLSDLRLRINKFWGYDHDLHSVRLGCHPTDGFSQGCIFLQQLWNFASLTCFSIKSIASPVLGFGHYRKIAEMLLERCPQLECLELEEGSCVALELFERGRWPNLKTLYITGDPIQFCLSVITQIVQTFIDAHPKLESVNIADLAPLHIVYGPLRDLTLCSMETYIRLVHVQESTMHLEYLCVHDINVANAGARLSSLAALQSLVVLCTPFTAGVRNIEQHLPHIQKLHMAWPFNSGNQCVHQADIANPHGVFEDAFSFLRNMKRLTHLSGFFANLRYDRNCKPLRDVIVRRMADACPTLSFVELYHGGWVTIKRQGKYGKYAGWQQMGNVRGVRMEDWHGHKDS